MQTYETTQKARLNKSKWAILPTWSYAGILLQDVCSPMTKWAWRVRSGTVNFWIANI